MLARGAGGLHTRNVRRMYLPGDLTESQRAAIRPRTRERPPLQKLVYETESGIIVRASLFVPDHGIVKRPAVKDVWAYAK